MTDKEIDAQLDKIRHIYEQDRRGEEIIFTNGSKITIIQSGGVVRGSRSGLFNILE